MDSVIGHQRLPIRVQRRRSKGWKMPPNTVSVARPGRHGNPFIAGEWYQRGDPDACGWLRMIYTHSLVGALPGYIQIKTAAEAVEWYRWYRSVSPLTADDVRQLHGRNLACWCPLDQPCHADVLLELANSGPMTAQEEKPSQPSRDPKQQVRRAAG